MVGLRNDGLLRLPSHNKRRSWWLVVLSLFVVYVAIGHLGWDFTIDADGAEYLKMAHNLLDHGTYTFDGVNAVVGKPPGLSFLAAAYIYVAGSIEGFQWLQLVFMFAAFLFLALATERILGTIPALGLLMLLVFLWPLHLFTSRLLSEPVFFALSSAGLFFLGRSLESRHVVGPIACGAAFGLAAYMRPTNLFLPLMAVLIIVLVCRHRLRAVLLLLTVHVLVVAPWMVRNWTEFGRFVPMVANWGPLYYITDSDQYDVYFYQGSGIIRSSASYQTITGGEFQFNWRPNERFRSAALDNIREDVTGYLGRCCKQLLFVWSYLPGTKGMYTAAPGWFNLGRAVMLLFLAVIGAGAVWLYRRHRTGVLLCLGYAVYTAIIHFPVCTESRYLIHAYLWLLPLAFAGIMWLAARFRLPWAQPLKVPSDD
jgi:hypothetical protein